MMFEGNGTESLVVPSTLAFEGPGSFLLIAYEAVGFILTVVK